MGAADGPARQEGFLDALRAGGPAEDRGGARDLYGPLIGSWEGEVVDHLDGGAEQRQSAEFHFAWVLEGRAVQDLWIAPARSERPKVPGTGNRYGTTLRVYDPKLDAWRITWINPVDGRQVQQIGRRVGPDIVQVGALPDGTPTRWMFTEIAGDAFRWTGEVLAPDGRTWNLAGEFRARRLR